MAKRLFYVVYARREASFTPWDRQDRQVKTIKAGGEALAVWKAQHEQNGWEVVRVNADCFLAEKNGKQRSVGFHEYDPKTHDRLYTHGNYHFREVLDTGELIVTPKSKRSAAA